MSENKYTSYTTSRFRTELAANYSANELEFLAVVWSAEHIRNYMYGTNFYVVSDPKSLGSILKRS